MEIAPNGFDIRSLADASGCYIGRDPVPPDFDVTSARSTPGGFEMSFIGELDVEYSIESSTNLVDWSEIITLTNRTGTVLVTDPDAGQHPYRFYRATQHRAPLPPAGRDAAGLFQPVQELDHVADVAFRDKHVEPFRHAGQSLVARLNVGFGEGDDPVLRRVENQRIVGIALDQPGIPIAKAWFHPLTGRAVFMAAWGTAKLNF